MKNLDSLYEKKIDKETLKDIRGGDYCNSGGTETRFTSENGLSGSDTHTNIYNYNCKVSATYSSHNFGYMY